MQLSTVSHLLYSQRMFSTVNYLDFSTVSYLLDLQSVIYFLYILLLIYSVYTYKRRAIAFITKDYNVIGDF